MVLRDGALTFAKNSFPATDAAIITLSAANDGPQGGLKFFTPFGGFVVFGGSPVYYDLKTAMDLGRGNHLVASIQVTTTFAESGTANRLWFAVAVSSDPTFASDVTVIARGSEFATAGLVAGVSTEVVLPKLDDLVLTSGATGRRYLSVGPEVYVPTSDWTARGVDCHILPSAPRANIHYPNGYGTP